MKWKLRPAERDRAQARDEDRTPGGASGAQTALPCASTRLRQEAAACRAGFVPGRKHSAGLGRFPLSAHGSAAAHEERCRRFYPEQAK